MNYDYDEIQSYYDKGYSWRKIIEKYGITWATISKRVKSGHLKSRNKKESLNSTKCKSKIIRKNKNKPRIDWEEIQKEYDKGISWRGITKKYGISSSSINYAIKRGWFKSTRNRSEANSLFCKNNPEKLKHTKETKEKISKIRKKYIEENPDKVPYLMNHYSKGNSYPENYFSEVFENENVDLKFHLQVGIYELDFYNEDIKFYLEIDGEQHYCDTRIVESDLRRNKYLSDLGWCGCRIRWSEFKKKSFEEKREVINLIKNEINIRKMGAKLLMD